MESSFPPIDKIFHSVGKVRILKVLALEDELNITALAKKCGLNHSNVKDHIQDLINLELLIKKQFGWIKIITIDTSSDAGKQLKKFLRFWNDRSDNDESISSNKY